MTLITFTLKKFKKELVKVFEISQHIYKIIT